MKQNKREHPKEKSRLHLRNKHRQRYDFKSLTAACPALAAHVKLNEYQDESIDFFNPDAVKLLNKALLKQYYGIDHWDIPANYLCPPIPGRADYIHYAADLLNDSKSAVSKNKKATNIKCLDIGVGANCVYPIIGVKEYGWSFIGADIDPKALESATKIVDSNPSLKGKIALRLQSNPKNIFKGIIETDDFFDLTICNPPFHASLADARSGTMRKLKSLDPKKARNPVLNFGGQHNELICEGGEGVFLKTMIIQSKEFASSCNWFTSLVSKQSNLKNAISELNKQGAEEIKTIMMGQGNKTSRILAWTFRKPE
jgi:23S rRNA (adenine1618-N6)-methyltransferase